MGQVIEMPTCPWCTVVVHRDATGGMAPEGLNGTLWHAGCVEDLARTRLNEATLEEN
jgi:hypothetical protein